MTAARTLVRILPVLAAVSTVIAVSAPAAAVPVQQLLAEDLVLGGQRRAADHQRDAPLRITEVLADSADVGARDGYEYIEVANLSAQEARWDDYRIRSLTPLPDGTITAAALWDTEPASVVIPAGGVVVIRQSDVADDAPSARDFREHYGLGDDVVLLDARSAGIANRARRSIEIATRAGSAVDRVTLNAEGGPSVREGRGLHRDAEATTLFDGAPSPGSLQPEQRPERPLRAAYAGLPPRIQLRTEGWPLAEPGQGLTPVDAFTPGRPFTITAELRDDRAVTAASAVLRDERGGELELELRPDAFGAFSATVPAAETLGRQRLEQHARAQRRRRGPGDRAGAAERALLRDRRHRHGRLLPQRHRAGRDHGRGR